MLLVTVHPVTSIKMTKVSSLLHRMTLMMMTPLKLSKS